MLALHIDCSLAAFVHRSLIWDVLRSSQISINACVKVGVKSVTGRDKKEKPTMNRHIIALLLCAVSAAADYVVDWRVPQANDANANAWVADVVVPAGGEFCVAPLT